jgi:hypothetical protein
MSSKLRHPVRAIREPFGKAGLIVACLALVFAMAGGAFAAKGALTGKEKREVQKIAKKEAKKYAAQGKTGPAGPAGAKGDNGAKGAQGAKGDTGATGPQGPQGIQGPAGSFGSETLPSEQTLTGAWSVSGPEADAGEHLATISFPMAVSPPPTTLINFNGLGVEPAEGTFDIYPFDHFPGTEKEEEEAREAYELACPGNADIPAAAPGFLCIYTGSSNGPGSGFTLSLTNWEVAHEFGVSEPFDLAGTGGENLYVKGAWAVTGE